MKWQLQLQLQLRLNWVEAIMTHDRQMHILVGPLRSSPPGWRYISLMSGVVLNASKFSLFTCARSLTVVPCTCMQWLEISDQKSITMSGMVNAKSLIPNLFIIAITFAASLVSCVATSQPCRYTKSPNPTHIICSHLNWPEFLGTLSTRPNTPDQCSRHSQDMDNYTSIWQTIVLWSDLYF